MTSNKINKFLIKIINHLYAFKSYSILIAILYIFVVLTTILYLIYFNLSQPLKFGLLFLALIEYMYLIYTIVIEVKNREKIQKDLSLMLEVTTKYEKVINDIRVKNHENKNQLIIIKDLIDSNKSKAIKYIDTMLQTKYIDDIEMIQKVSNIPNGGLKGLIYYKLLLMKSQKIECHLEIAKNIDKNIFNNISVELVQNFYKIVGVFLDNAIEATSLLNKKIILIELYFEEDYLFLSIANEYKNKIDFDKLGKVRVTTKGENHGYGLQLVRDLINNHSELQHQTEIIGNLFVQKVGIKIKG